MAERKTKDGPFAARSTSGGSWEVVQQPSERCPTCKRANYPRGERIIAYAYYVLTYAEQQQIAEDIADALNAAWSRRADDADA